MVQVRAISSCKAIHIKTCYLMRDAFELLDYEDASISDLKRMLLQASAGSVRRQLTCSYAVYVHSSWMYYMDL